MSYRPKGKKVRIDKNFPEALGICDFTGFVHLRKDLIRQMEWRGERLVWTGFLVGKDYADIPNEQLRAPILRPDPVPVLYPRLPQGSALFFNTMSEPFNFQNIPFNVIQPVNDGVDALPADIRLQQAQNAYFGSFA